MAITNEHPCSVRLGEYQGVQAPDLRVSKTRTGEGRSEDRHTEDSRARELAHLHSKEQQPGQPGRGPARSLTVGLPASRPGER